MLRPSDSLVPEGGLSLFHFLLRDYKLGFCCFQSKESDWLTQWAGPSHTNLIKIILHSCPDSVDSHLLRLPLEVIPGCVKLTIKAKGHSRPFAKAETVRAEGQPTPLYRGGHVKVSHRLRCSHIQLPAVGLFRTRVHSWQT